MKLLSPAEITEVSPAETAAFVGPILGTQTDHLPAMNGKYERSGPGRSHLGTAASPGRVQRGRPPHPACPILHPPAGRKPLSLFNENVLPTVK